jgi:eukaryotic-like serine/threonine-protein kinase
MKTVQPTQFGKFLLLEPLGSTRTSEMFRAVDLSRRFFDGFVLLKRLVPSLGNDLRATKILVYEAKVTRELTHPAIIKILEAGKVRDNLFITEEHPWGRSLLAVLRQLRESKKKMDPEIAIYLAIQICRALDYAHTRKLSFGNKRFVVHRNLSLKNIWIAFDGTVHLYDFGTEPVSLTGPDATNLDFRSICALSPEQVSQGYYDHRTDIFSLGTILYELLTGVHPFKGKDLATVQKLILAASPAPTTTHAPVPAEFDKVVSKCLAKNIENRYPRASTMLLQLESLLATLDDGLDQDGLGNWMKNLFQKEIFLEIRSLHEAFSQCLGSGAMVLRSIPAYLFQRSQPKARAGKVDKTAPAVKTRAIVELEEETRVMLEQDSAVSDSMETILIDDAPGRETGVLSVDEEQSIVENYEPPDAHL